MECTKVRAPPPHARFSPIGASNHELHVAKGVTLTARSGLTCCESTEDNLCELISVSSLQELRFSQFVLCAWLPACPVFPRVPSERARPEKDFKVKVN
jgi:hypothetical protein